MTLVVLMCMTPILNAAIAKFISQWYHQMECCSGRLTKQKIYRPAESYWQSRGTWLNSTQILEPVLLSEIWYMQESEYPQGTVLVPEIYLKVKTLVTVTFRILKQLDACHQHFETAPQVVKFIL